MRPGGKPPLRLTLSPRPAHAVDKRYLSISVDLGQIAHPRRFWNPKGTGETAHHHFDFKHPNVKTAAAALAPAYLRIGGTEADRVYYALAGPVPSKPPKPYLSVLSAEQIDEIGNFAKQLGLDIVFTLNAGLGVRKGKTMQWDPSQCRQLMQYAKARAYPFNVWELGNEPNAWPLFHGLFVSPEEYARDLHMLAKVRDAECSEALISAPSTAWWPKIGDVPSIGLVRPSWRKPCPLRISRRFLERVLTVSSTLTPPDILSWHYYPGLSNRSNLARYYWQARTLAITGASSIAAQLFSAAVSNGAMFALITIAVFATHLRRRNSSAHHSLWVTSQMAGGVLVADAFPKSFQKSHPTIIVAMTVVAGMVWGVSLLITLLVRPIDKQSLRSPDVLNTAHYWGTHVLAAGEAISNAETRPQIWLGETGSAQVGGQPGVCGTWASSLWWLDQLGSLARLGHSVQCRQTLAGSDYGLLDEKSLEPKPDFWASMLWKLLMGTDVFKLECDPVRDTLRLYCHSTTEQAAQALLGRKCAEYDSRTFLLLNLGYEDVHVHLTSEQRLHKVWLLDAPAMNSRVVTLNGMLCTLQPDGSLPDMLRSCDSHAVESELDIRIPRGAAVFALITLVRGEK